MILVIMKNVLIGITKIIILSKRNKSNQLGRVARDRHVTIAGLSWNHRIRQENVIGITSRFYYFTFCLDCSLSVFMNPKVSGKEFGVGIYTVSPLWNIYFQ